jgi:hypothetical protein
LPLDPKIHWFTPKVDGFLRAIKIRSTTSFRGEVKAVSPLSRVYGMLKNPMTVKRVLCKQNLKDISHQISPAVLLDLLVIAGVLVNESGMIRTQMGTHNRSEMGAVQGSPRAPTTQQ